MHSLRQIMVLERNKSLYFRKRVSKARLVDGSIKFLNIDVSFLYFVI